MPIAREGFPFLAVSALVTLGFAIGHIWVGAFVGAFLSLYIAYFFRNPERVIPPGSDLLVSPADGKVIFVGPATEKDFLGKETLKISVFMSLTDVHINRVPVDSQVKAMRYHPGRFLAAWDESASEENERQALLLETSRGAKIVLAQIAGLVARRILCYASVGDHLRKGQRLGLIRFGSRCDLFLPQGSQVLVETGMKVRGGETILAQLPAEVTA